MNGAFERVWRAVESLALEQGDLKHRLKDARDELCEDGAAWDELPGRLRAEAADLCAVLNGTAVAEMDEALVSRCAKRILELAADVHAAMLQQIREFVDREQENVDA